MSDTAQWITLMTVIAGFIYQWFSTKRQRAWDVADRAALAEKVLTEAAIVKRQLAGVGVALGDAIADNTKISTDAFHEANRVNLKLEKLGLDHNALQRKEQDRK